jgi:hypothetical protein
MCGKPLHQPLRQIVLSRGDRADRPHHFRLLAGFRQITAGTGIHRPLDVLRRFVDGNQDDARLGMGGEDPAGHLDAVHVRQHAIHQRDVRAQGFEQFQRLGAVARLAHDLHVAFPVQRADETQGDHEVVIDD